MKKASDERVGGPPKVNISHGFGRFMAPGSKYRASVDNNSLSRNSGWRKILGLRCLLGKVGHSISVWQARYLQPYGNRWIPDVCWRYLVGACIGWDWSRRRSGRYDDGKKKLTWDQHLLEIFSPRPTSVVEIWSGMVLVQDIWSVSTSVEDFNALTKVLIGIWPCDYLGG